MEKCLFNAGRNGRENVQFELLQLQKNPFRNRSYRKSNSCECYYDDEMSVGMETESEANDVVLLLDQYFAINIVSVLLSLSSCGKIEFFLGLLSLEMI